MSKKEYKLNIANSKSIGLSQELYSGIIDYMKYYIIGKGTSWFNTYFPSNRSAGWLWTQSEDAKTTYLGESGTTPYAEIFAANNDKAKIALYKEKYFLVFGNNEK